MKELKGLNPQFIIPVKLGEIPVFPPFIESKRYINLAAMTERQWLNEIRGAILGVSVQPSDERAENLETVRTVTEDVAETVGIMFKARYWAEEVGFKVTTSERIVERKFLFPDRPVLPTLSVIERAEDYLYAVRIPSERITPGDRFAMALRFPEGVNPLVVPMEVERWNGKGGSASLQFFGS